MNVVKETIQSYYKSNTGFLAEYGGSLFMTILLILIAVIAFTYIYIRAHLKTIRSNWDTQRCNPLYIPFAGMIYPTNNPTEYTKENFNRCTNQILHNIVDYFLQPFVYVFQLLGKDAKLVIHMSSVIKQRLEEMGDHLEHITTDIAKHIMTAFIPVQNIIIKMRDTMNKIIGTLIVQLYTVFGVYLGLQSFFGAFIQAVILGLFAIIAIVIPLLAGFFTAPLAIPALALFAVIAGILSAILIGISPVVDVGKYVIPKKPSMPHFCFDSHTPLYLNTNEMVFIHELNIGDILEDGSVILGILKLDSENVDMYEYKGHIISGSHSVWIEQSTPTFHNYNSWRKIKDICNKRISSYSKPYIYCLITDTKYIPLRNRLKPKETFYVCDWDEWFCVEPFLNQSYIHEEHQIGLQKNTRILMNDNTWKSIDEICVGDSLYGFNNKVSGIVKMKTPNYLYHYPLEELDDYYSLYKSYDEDDMHTNSLCSTSHLYILNYYSGDRKNTRHIDFKCTKINLHECEQYEYMYHLITTEGWFCANRIIIEDFNSNLNFYNFYSNESI